MSSESEISDYSQTLSKPEEEEMKKEEDDYVQVIFSQIEPYQDEPLAEDDSAGEGNEVDYSSPLRDHETSCPEGLVIDMREK